MTNRPTSFLRSLIVCLAGSLAVSCGSNPPPPVIEGISPAALCALNGTRSYTITGTGFLKNDMLPMVSFTRLGDAAPSVTTQASDASGCEGQQCTALSVSLSSSELPEGTYNVAIKNNCELDTCKSAQVGPPAQVVVVAPPTLTAVTPTVICQGQGSLTLTGSKFYSGAVVSVGPAKSTSLTVSSDGQSATAMFSGMLPLSMVDQTTLTAIPQDITIENIAGCSATLPGAVAITPGPSILFVDPPVVPANYSIQATVYGASVASPVTSVQIAAAGSGNYSSVTITTDPLHPNRVLFTLPGNLSAGSYDLKLNDQTTCSAMLPNAIKVVATPTLTVNTPSPSFGALSANTAVSISGTGFVSTPRAYVAVNGGAAGVSASALRAVTYGSATALTAVVPSGLSAGTYDLIIVNPSGSYGIKTSAFVVTALNQPPPVVTGVSPSSVVVATNASITVQGSNFRTPTITPSCYDATNVLLGGAVSNVSGSSATSITATLNAPANSIYCTLRVRNGDNNTFFDFSAVGVTNAGLNLTGYKAATNMVTARRASAGAAGRPTQVARYVYVSGGDNGTNNNPLSSVEFASSGLDGSLGAFSVLSQPLPKALSFHGMVNIGRFLYVVGGFDGTAASKSVYRAELLDPLNAPQFSDVDVRPDMTQGLAPGLYSYRIAAVMGATDANNPGGETLASDVFPVQIPTLSMGSLQLVLYFKQVPGAQSYKIYRTIAANDSAGNERLLATVTDSGQATQSYIDNGQTAPSGAVPLPLGSIGAWKTLASLNTARASAGIVAAPDPATAGTFYLYALGGNSGNLTTVTPVASAEFLTITLVGGGAQQTTSATWTPTTNSLPSARWLAPGLFATNVQNSNVAANQTFIYLASGITSDIATATLDKPVYVAQVAAGGQPGTFGSSGSVGVNGFGFGSALVNNQMYAFGGFQGGAPSTASVSANLTAGNTLANFNALGSGTLTVARSLHATAIESAFIYQLGGLGAGATVLRSTEQTIW